MEDFLVRDRRGYKRKIPEAHTDYVLASISEEYGIVAIIIILIIIFSLFMRVFAICQNEISILKNILLSPFYLGFIANFY